MRLDTRLRGYDMRCVLGLDIGTTSTIGVLIRPPDQTLALASRPVALRSDHVGWAEEDPEQWWANVGEIVRELMRSSGASPADVAAVGVTGMLPAMVLLDAAGRLLRPSIQQSDARCGAEVAELRAEIDENAFLAKAGNGINQQLVAAKLRWIERHEPEVFARIARCSAPTTTSTGASRLSARSSRTGRWKQGSST